MKRLRHLLLIVATSPVFAVSLSVQAGELPKAVSPTTNMAQIVSPRYLEEHPGLLMGLSSGKISVTLQARGPSSIATNSALANSPRYLEDHPELLWRLSPTLRSIATNISESERLEKLTKNKALASNPRFLEEHTELLVRKPALEIAPRQSLQNVLQRWMADGCGHPAVVTINPARVCWLANVSSGNRRQNYDIMTSNPDDAPRTGHGSSRPSGAWTDKIEDAGFLRATSASLPAHQSITRKETQ